MIDVLVRGDLPLAAQVCNWLNSHQKHFRLSVALEECTFTLLLNGEPYHGLFRVIDSTTVGVSTWQCPGLCFYANMEMQELISICAFLGLMHVRALRLNEHLRVEDFIHTPEKGCLFSTLALKQDFAEVLEHLHICQGCIDFYRCLGLEPEVDALLRVLRSLQGLETVQSHESS
jgi:hypothetical protein